MQSIIVNPATDPHSYEPTPSDARTMAIAKVAIVNGIGYDNWASQLLDANPDGGRVVVDAGDVLGLKDGDNPHQWYSPTLGRARWSTRSSPPTTRPTRPDALLLRRRASARSSTAALARYDALLAADPPPVRRRARSATARASSSRSGRASGLRLATPAGFAKAVAEGNEISAADKQTVERQLRRHLVKVWVFNSQNVTPDVERLTSLARAEHIPVVTITETLSPATATLPAVAGGRARGLLRALTARRR